MTQLTGNHEGFALAPPAAPALCQGCSRGVWQGSGSGDLAPGAQNQGRELPSFAGQRLPAPQDPQRMAEGNEA